MYICSLKKENRKISWKNRGFKEADRAGMLAMDLFSFQEETYLTIIDLLTGETWILPVLSKDKPEVELIFKTWFESMGAEFQLKYSKLLSDQGDEFNFDVHELK